MNRIDELFKRKNRNILSVYFTAGYPKLSDTESILIELEKSGVDMIEIGFPFSDPLADGPVIQHSSEIALKNGMSLNLLFDQLKNIRQKINIPLILMGYLNPVMQYGVEKFCRDAALVGIDGIILPDLPIEIFMDEYKSMFENYCLHFITLITPQTNDMRIKQIDNSCRGFLYMVSSSSTTGTKTVIDSNLSAFSERIQKLKLKNPQMIGFGINDKSSFEHVCQFANGGIIGTAFIKALNSNNSIERNIQEFITTLK